MRYEELVAHFGGPTNAAQALGKKNKQSVHVWRRRRIPSRWQLKASVLSGGKLKPDRQALRDARELAGYLQANGSI